MSNRYAVVLLLATALLSACDDRSIQQINDDNIREYTKCKAAGMQSEMTVYGNVVCRAPKE